MALPKGAVEREEPTNHFENARELHIHHANTGFNARFSMWLYAALLVFSVTLLTTLFTFDVVKVDSLTDDAATTTEKIMFMLVAVPLGLLVTVTTLTVGAFVMSQVLRFVDDRRLELIFLAVLGLLIILFMWYVNRQRRLSSTTTTDDGHIHPIGPRKFHLGVWETVKLPYKTALEGVLFVLQNAVWLLFGVTAMEWLKKRHGTIGYFALLAAFLYLYYYISFSI